ncbi:hypothetical protein HU200_017050 [Digitaria exilis]|uniref:Small ribosomal subunit protein uS15c n=1 Tax=Digitaria exilis TaxID=1010633 RepID=A0A835KI00_9POAL|nr:hypothetical protein HU200_017050 [Digitaria exilis]CAB3451390.1 unnamed protein product [Digitaria exilis]
MALRRITTRRRPLLHVPRALFSSNSPFPPPPPLPPPANDRDAAHSPSSSPHPNPGAPRDSSFTLFADIRERIRSSPPSPPLPRRTPVNSPRPNSAPSKNVDDVRRALESFRGSGDATSPSAPGARPSTPGAAPSFIDLLKNQGPNTGQGMPGFSSIREKLKTSATLQRQPLQRQTPFMTPVSSSSGIFNKELAAKAEGPGKGEGKDSGIELMRNYTYEDLGKRLGELRPPGAAKDGKEWFSLEELQGRIAKLVELEKQEDQFRGQYNDLRRSIYNITKPAKQAPPVSMPMLLNLGGQLTQDYTRLPPQEELLERYFHPDHMSSEEKMKLELQRVRDEFKMSENDCGSARVQIAQLTLKIKHLSAVLHKKDKHSRKGLQEMVQRRKKYLKYLRRTDWDSYCLVLSKLGLRDVPEYKAPDYKSKPTTKAKAKKKKSKSKKRKMRA